MSKVIQADRDAAMRSVKHMKFAYDPAKMAAGGYDLDPLVLSYTDHRLAEQERCRFAAERAGNFGDYTRDELTSDFGQPRFDLMHKIINAIQESHP